MGTSRDKRHYRSRDELRRLLIDEGIALLVEDGMRGGENVTLAKVIERLRRRGDAPVTKGSVLGRDRLWTNQRAFQLDVQRAFATQVGDVGITAGGTHEAAATVISAADLSTALGRSRAVRELCRVAARATFDGVVQSRDWRIWLAIWATAMTTDDEAVVGDAIREGELIVSRAVAESLYVPFAALVGMRIKDEYGPDGMAMFTLCVAALTDGLAIRERYSAIPLDHVARHVPAGTTEQWHLFSVGFEALVNQFFEPEPDVADASISR